MAAQSESTLLSPERLQQQIADLGDWFHNINLRGVWTAPQHFLGDYPNVKWKHLCSALPQDLSGASVLDLGCNAGFYSIEMKKRNASAAEAMLRSSGLEIVAHPEEETWICEPRRTKRNGEYLLDLELAGKL